APASAEPGHPPGGSRGRIGVVGWVPLCCDTFFVMFQRVAYVVEPVRLPFMQPDAGAAELAQRALAVRNHDQPRVVGQVLEGGGRLVLEGGVAGGSNLV